MILRIALVDLSINQTTMIDIAEAVSLIRLILWKAGITLRD
jgi:hypothetical protein